MMEAMQVITEIEEIVSVDESKLLAHFGLLGLSEIQQ